MYGVGTSYNAKCAGFKRCRYWPLLKNRNLKGGIKVPRNIKIGQKSLSSTYG